MTKHSDRPWLAHPDWSNGRIHSNAGSAWKFLAGFALFWNLFAFGIANAIMLDNPPRFPDPVYFVLLFPAVGLLLLWQAFKQYRQWRRHGRLNLSLDPYPGSIGGDVGGQVNVRADPATLADLEATLSCIRVSISRGSKNSSRNETVIWRQRANTRVDRTANGARIAFRVMVDAGLPDAEPPASKHNQWLLHLKSEAAGLDRSFDIPVFDTGHAEESRLHIDATPMTTEPGQFPTDIVRVQRRPDGLELVYPRSRGAVGWMLLVFGLVFAGVGLFLGYDSVFSSSSLFAIGITGFMALVFSMVGLLIVGIALYLLLNVLRVLVGRDTLTTRRSLGPWHWLRSAPIAGITSVDKTISMQSGSGATATVYYSLKAKTTDRDLTIGDGIKGQPLADGLLDLIRRELPQLGATASSPPSALHQQGFGSKPLVDGSQGKRRKTAVKVFKWVVNLIAIVFVGLFLMDFLDLWR